MTLALQLLGGLALLLIGGEALVRGAAQIATRLGLSRLIVGMVIAGFGTSLPELVVSVRAVWASAPGLAAGNVIGSNISNILLILGVAALIRPIQATRRHIEPEGIALLVVSAAIVLLLLQGTVPRWQGGLMVVALLMLVGVKLQQERSAAGRRRATESVTQTVAPIGARSWPPLAMILVGIVMLPAGGELFVLGATRVAESLGVSNALIGLTVVAVGTSLPELATTVMAALRGEATIGYGNVVGSNLFNLLGIFGCATMAGEMAVPAVMVYIDGAVMIGATCLMLWFLASRAELSRIEAAIMVGAYFGYVAARYAYAFG